MQKTFINAIILIVIFISGAITGSGGLYLYSKKSLATITEQVSRIENTNIELQDTNRQLTEYNTELESRLDRREIYIRELESIINEARELDRTADKIIYDIEAIFNLY